MIWPIIHDMEDRFTSNDNANAWFWKWGAVLKTELEMHHIPAKIFNILEKY